MVIRIPRKTVFSCHNEYHGQIWSDFGAFGEVLAENITRWHAEITSRNADMWHFSVASGEILGQNLTKWPKPHQMPVSYPWLHPDDPDPKGTLRMLRTESLLSSPRNLYIKYKL